MLTVTSWKVSGAAENSLGERRNITRETCARHAREVYLRYICKYVQQCVAVEC